MRGIDLVGQALMGALNQGGQGLGAGMMDAYKRKQVADILNRLQDRSQNPQYGNVPGFTGPVEQPPIPILDQRNIGDLGQLGELSPQTIAALKMTQSDPVHFGPGTTYGERTPGGDYIIKGQTGFEPRAGGRQQWPQIKKEKVYGKGGQQAWMLSYGDPETGQVYSTEWREIGGDGGNGNGSGDGNPKNQKGKVVVPIETEEGTQQRDFTGTLGEISTSLQIEKRAIENNLAPYTQMGLDLNAVVNGDLESINRWVEQHFPQQNGAPDPRAISVVRLVRNWKRIMDKETEVNNAGGGVGEFPGKPSQPKEQRRVPLPPPAQSSAVPYPAPGQGSGNPLPQSGGEKTETFVVGGKTYRIPKSRVAAFKKAKGIK